MKKRVILMKFKIAIKLVFPDDASRAIDIDEFEEQGVLRVFLCEDEGTLEAGVGPLVGVWVSIKYASKSIKYASKSIKYASKSIKYASKSIKYASKSVAENCF